MINLNNTNFRFKIITFFLVTCFIFVFRFVPHPPNFTPIIAMTLYGSIFFGYRSIPFIILAFAISDIFLGFHKLLLFTWGSLGIIGIIHTFFTSFLSRILGCIISASVFYILTNFGVWLLSDFYSNDFNGLINCYILAIPFFGNTMFSTILFGLMCELIYSSKKSFFIENIK